MRTTTVTLQFACLIRFGAALMAVSLIANASAAERPNILWLTSEDHGPEMGCYGDANARTPNVDRLAAQGMIFTRVWSVHPVCAPARSAIISGMYAHSSGAMHMRSMVPMPKGTKMFPELLREAGYYATNSEKEDYNLRKTEQTWDESSKAAHWRNRREGQPFFAVFNSTKSHESQMRTRPHTAIADPAKMRVPAYHPDLPEVRQDWAQYYDKVSEADVDAGARLREIEEAGLADDTIVFYYGDHGSGMPRSKRWPGNSGLQVPLVVYFPPKWRHLAPEEYQPGGKSDRLVSFVDLAPTVLSLAGLRAPEWMQGQTFAGESSGERQEFLFGARGRMDERGDEVRSVTDGRYVYLRNFHLHTPQGPYIAYQFQTPTTRIWYEQYTARKTNDAQSIFWRTPRAPEELYDLRTDPDEVRNLADSAEHQKIRKRLRAALYQHLSDVRDVCLLPEGEMFVRSRGASPYDMARDGEVYPFARVLAAADIAARMDGGDIDQLHDLLGDKDDAVRYWAALGVLMRGEDAVRSSKDALRKALRDPSPLVRVTAANAIARHWNDSDAKAAIALLAEHADPATHGFFVALDALQAIDALGSRSAPVAGRLRQIDPNANLPDRRYSGYVTSLLDSILERSLQTPAAAE